jgi:RimJ/RimL family protein N-acetyltransferase
VGRNSFRIYWAVTLSNSPKLIGTVCLWNFNNKGTKAEIGYELHPDFQGKGIMQEAVKEVINYGFNRLKLSLISAYTHQDNSKSIMLLEKNGFTFYKKSEDSFIYNLFNNLSDE